ncbi:MAG TPA: ATP-binding protein [Xanthobacteraceae bacterium]|nr:ATP-binding protein [Xanthobacteraceae bacterium]
MAINEGVKQRDRSLVRGLLEALPEATLVIGEDDRVVAANAVARSLLPSLRRDELLARSLRSPDVLDSVARVRASGRSERVVWLEKVPVERSFEVSIAPFGDEGFDPAVILSLRDLTEARRLERMRVDFVANASHELRTPLAALSGFIETLQGTAREDSKARERFLIIMQEQARRMARLIDDLLSLSRIELNAHRRPDTPVDLAPIVHQVVDGLQTLARDRGVTVQVEAAGALTVPGDRDELVRVVENLLENALKYGAAGKRVDITLAQDVSSAGEPEALVGVRDYGPGIAPEHLPRLTERFYRVDVSESRAQGGTGLGLALVKHILNRHRGRLSIESRPGAGATFVVHLPVAGSQISDK